MSGTARGRSRPDAHPDAATPVPLAGANGTAGGAALVDRHTATLASHSFALRVGATEVESMPRASAFTYEGVSLGFGSIRVFSVAGTTYRLHETDDGVTVEEQPYDRNSPESDEGDDVATATEVETFTVTAVGMVTVSRPDAFCVASSAVAGDDTATPTPSVTALQNGTVGQFTAVAGPSKRTNGTD